MSGFNPGRSPDPGSPAASSPEDFGYWLTAASDWFWRTDADLRVTYVSPSFFRETGISPDRPIGHRIDGLFGSAGETEAGRAVIAAILGHEPFRNFVRPFVDAAGRTVYVRLNGVPAFAPDGMFEGYRGSGCNATGEYAALEEAVRIQNRLAHRTRELRSIVDSIPDGIVISDEVGTIEFCNPAITRLFGYSEAELIGRNVTILMDEPDRSRHDSILQRYRETGEGHIVNVGPRQLTGRRADGSVLPIDLAIGEAMVDQRRLFVGTIRDISRRIRIEQELESSRQSLADAQRIARFGSWWLDLRTGEAHWSDELYRLMGLEPGVDAPTEDLGYQTTHPEDRELVRLNFERAMERPGLVASFDYRMVPLGAPPRTVHAEFRVLLDDAGAPARLVGTAQDVTEARRMADRLARSERSLIQAQRLSRIGSWEVDLTSGDVRWSQGLYELFGLEPDDAMPSFDRFYALLGQAEADRLRANAVPLWSGEIPSDSLEWRMTGPDGRDRIFHGEVEAERDAQGRTVRLLGTVQDVTELRAAEQRLSQALHEANAANRTKSQFLANMSHELRTPLNAIIGFSELVALQLRRVPDSEKLQGYVQDIHGSGLHLLGIIEDVLDMSRAEADRFSLREEPFALIDIIDWVVRMGLGSSHGSRAELRFDGGRDLPVLMGEARLIRQALLNLVSNALKVSSADGSVVLDVATTEEGDIAIGVSDSGPGIRQEDIPVALTPFGQLDPVLTRKFGGAGLGLPLAKKFAELHGGRLEIVSRVGEGTIVSLILPRDRVVQR